MEAEKTLKEAQSAELGIEDSTENTEKADTDENKTNTDSIKDNISDAETKEASVHESVQKNRAVLQEHKITLAEAETTPEALKVKRAKVQAAYKESQARAPKPILDLKIE